MVMVVTFAALTTVTALTAMTMARSYFPGGGVSAVVNVLAVVRLVRVVNVPTVLTPLPSAIALAPAQPPSQTQTQLPRPLRFLRFRIYIPLC